MQLTIKIDGDTAKELFAVGPNDLLNYFMPNIWGIDQKDVVSIYFSDWKDRIDGKVTDDLDEGDYIVHSDNYHRDQQKY